ncbi:MAG TPA: DUF2927 domain-containing protein, partial [Rhodobacteraceae bacterium]|nr:DUF2927 domain-containing protein [Paracoccaceae bacterium]
MKAFSGASASRPDRPNSQIAGDFLDLAFQLESGRALPVFSRFEGPITIAVQGRAPRVLQADLDRLLSRLRIEAGIDVRRYDPARAGGRPASITLEIIPKARLQALVPSAACFVAPNVSSWAEYKRLRNRPETDWTRLTTRTRMAIFLPGDVAPQEMRDCLHEEIAQSMGPLNDLYRLSDSVYNDDNFHTVLTGFDMLILRAYYAPELRSGMTRAEVAARLPAILARLNPGGGTGAPELTPPTPRAWIDTIEAAVGQRGSQSSRRAAASRAVALARSYGWYDTRLAFSLFALGRLNLGFDSQLALESFREAERIYRTLPGSELQAANMGVQLAAYALSGGRAQEALDQVNDHIAPVMSAENAALLATLLMIKAEALTMLGRDTEARLVRLDSLGWARYGFG